MGLSDESVAIMKACHPVLEGVQEVGLTSCQQIIMLTF